VESNKLFLLLPFPLLFPDPVLYSVVTVPSCSYGFLAFRTAANGSPGNGSPPGSDRKRVKRPYQTKTFKVELCFAAKIPMSAIAMALKGQESEHTQEAIRVIDIILRQHSAKQYVASSLLLKASLPILHGSTLSHSLC
jgi:hypothetical protein